SRLPSLFNEPVQTGSVILWPRTARTTAVDAELGLRNDRPGGQPDHELAVRTSVRICLSSTDSAARSARPSSKSPIALRGREIAAALVCSHSVTRSSLGSPDVVELITSAVSAARAA